MDKAVGAGELVYTTDPTSLVRARGESRTLAVLLFFLGVALNQSSVIFGTNLSFSDFFCLCLIIYLAAKKRFRVPKAVLLFFIIVASASLLTPFFIIPWKFNYYPRLSQVLIDLIKMIASLAYLLIGINLSRINKLGKLFRYFSYFSFLIAVGAVLFTFVRIPQINELLFYGNVRYRGLMNDPNYFAILQNIAIVYFIKKSRLRQSWKSLIILVLGYSVLLSGSKTGMIALLASSLMLLFKKAIWGKKNLNGTFKTVSAALIALLGGYHYRQELLAGLERFAQTNHSFERIYAMLINFTGAVSGGGSGRMGTWEMALTLIDESPFIGIGIGTYTGLIGSNYNYWDIAHNTYLQLAVEWGVPLAAVFFSVLFYTYIKAWFSRREDLDVLNSMLFIFLIGSMAVSLNNARIFWAIFGALMYLNRRGKMVIETEGEMGPEIGTGRIKPESETEVQEKASFRPVGLQPMS